MIAPPLTVLPAPAPASATKAHSSCSTGSPFCGVLWPGTENRGADAHQGGALLHGDLEVGGHAHRQRAHARFEPLSQLGKPPEDRALVLGRGRRGGHEHQAPPPRSEEHTSELPSRKELVCR